MRAVLSGVLLCVAAAAGVAPAAPPSITPRSYATGRGASSVAIADLNGDGSPDLATADSRGGAVSVLLNRGDGTFRPRHDYLTGRAPSSLAVGDLNGDDKPDVVTGNGGKTVSILLNAGNGSFRTSADYPTGPHPQVALGDLNGDGSLDLVVASDRATDTLAVLLGKGDGTFAPRREYPTTTGEFPQNVVVADLNGDGAADLATPDLGSHVSVLRGRGDGTFRPALVLRVQYPAGWIAAGDVDGDGATDLVITTALRIESLAVLQNRGDGSFRSEDRARTRDLAFAVALGNVDGDGRLDAATVNEDGTVSVFDGPSFAARREYSAHSSARALAIGDVTGDARPDLVIADAATVSVLPDPPRLCAAPQVWRKTLPVARRAIAGAHCRVGSIRRAYSRFVGKGRVSSQRPSPDTALAPGGPVDLVVSRGPKP